MYPTPPEDDDPALPAALAREAADPATPAVRLRDLAARIEHQEVLRAVAGNPSTPPDVLLGLLPLYRDTVCRNPMAPLIALEAPQAILDLPREDQAKLLRWPDAPAPLVGLLVSGAENPDVRAEAALHVALAGEMGVGEDVGDALRAFWHDHAAGAAGERRQAYIELAEAGLLPAWAAGPESHPEPYAGLPPATELLATGAAAHPDRADEIARAADPRTPPDELERLATAGRRLPPPTRPSLVNTAQRGPEWYLRLAVAGNPRASARALRGLSNDLYAHGDMDDPIRVALAKNPVIPQRLLADMAGAGRDEGAGLRRLLRRSLNVPLPGTYEGDSLMRHFDRTAREWNAHLPLPRFAALLTGAVASEETRATLRNAVMTAHPWWDRLAAAVALPLASSADHAALRLLARDGNCLVAGVARARLADPTWEFRW
jgi:hypothetical protein